MFKPLKPLEVGFPYGADQSSQGTSLENSRNTWTFRTLCLKMSRKKLIYVLIFHTLSVIEGLHPVGHPQDCVHDYAVLLRRSKGRLEQKSFLTCFLPFFLSPLH